MLMKTQDFYLFSGQTFTFSMLIIATGVRRVKHEEMPPTWELSKLPETLKINLKDDLSIQKGESMLPTTAA